MPKSECGAENDTLDGPLLPMELAEDLHLRHAKSNDLCRGLKLPGLIALAGFIMIGTLILFARSTSVAAVPSLGFDSETPTRPPLPLSPESGWLTVDADLSKPPTYRDVIETQTNLPQHNPELPYPEGRTGRYVKFSSKRELLLGWNNKLAEILFQTHLSYKSKRAYVFQDYIWAPHHYPWYGSVPEDPPARTPLGALLSGPPAGGSWPPGDPAPRSVHESYWDIVCPRDKVKEIWTQDVKKEYGLHEWEYTNGTKIIDTWTKILLEDPATCIDIIAPSDDVEALPEVFDLGLLTKEKILDTWNDFGEGLVSKLLGASPVVQRTVQHNQHLFETPQTNGSEPFSRLLAVHIRRGDYTSHCKFLAAWKERFFGWNLFSWLPDRFTAPDPDRAFEGDEWQANEDMYLKRCLPDMDTMIEKINLVRDDWEKEYFGDTLQGEHYITTLYVLTNAQQEWRDEFANKLKEFHQWKVLTSHDIVWNDAQEKDVGMATDMELARRAAIFMGNGWSSFTSSILHRRLVDKKIAISNRFL